ncbi:MAG: hypothetical protein K2X77_31390 [Candidatus Obscuribacterales bacterium]|jgi:Flp pilus assembly protein TadD|nr:hypothetical protein [Candidatus Obscuribacterales bacterium]
MIRIHSGLKTFTIASSLMLCSVFALEAKATPVLGGSVSGEGLQTAVKNCTEEKTKEQAINMAVIYILAAKAKAQALEDNPKSEAIRYLMANSMMGRHKFDVLSNKMSQWIEEATDAEETLAVANLAIKVGDLESAKAAFMKAKVLPDGAAPSERGLETIAWTKQQSKNYMLAAKARIDHGKISEAVDELNNALSIDPKNPEVRLMIADTLLKSSHKGPSTLRSAANHYKAYLALKPDLGSRKDKLDRRIASLESKASKAEQKLIAGTNKTL